MLNFIKHLIENLNNSKINYCHWKSNFYLEHALSGIGDLDILVERQDAQKFEAILASMDFKRAIDPLQTPCPSIFHFYGLDSETGILVHLHVYYRVITGESLLKNYSFPIEKLLLTNPQLSEKIPIPQKPAELMLFVLRMMVKHASVLEYLLLWRSNENLKDELEYLLADDSASRCSELLKDWLPSVDTSLFNQCLDCIQKGSPFARHFWLAIRLRGQLKSLNRLSLVAEWFLRIKLFTQRIFWRLWGSGKSKQLASGGAVIAFVGAEATGKSTLVKETVGWLGKIFNVSSYHLGKPPSTWISFFPNLTAPLLRLVANQDRPSLVESTSSKQDGRVSLLYSIRAVLVAWDRYRLALKIRRQAVNGRLAICDRYPSTNVGAMDSPRLKFQNGKVWKGQLLNYLVEIEHHIYQQIPPPDIVIQLTVPLEVAIKRNQQRQKQEPENYLVSRHTNRVVPLFTKSTVVELDSNQTKSQTSNFVRRFLWQVL